MPFVTLSNPMAAPRIIPFVAGEQVSGLRARAGVGAGILFVCCGATLLETDTVTPNAILSLVPRLVAGHGHMSHMSYDSRLSVSRPAGQMTQAEARALAAEGLAAGEKRARTAAEARALAAEAQALAAEAQALAAEARANKEATARAEAEAEVERLRHYLTLGPPRAKQT